MVTEKKDSHHFGSDGTGITNCFGHCSVAVGVAIVHLALANWPPLTAKEFPGDTNARDLVLKSNKRLSLASLNISILLRAPCVTLAWLATSSAR